MKSGDIVTIAVGILMVIAIAIVANPQYLAGLRQAIPLSHPEIVTVPAQTPTIPPVTIPVAQPTLLPTTPSHRAYASPERIFYSPTPLKYPVYRMPENLLIFGASDIPLRNREMVPFAYIEEKRGGLTNLFFVPYPIWVMNITVVSEINPQYGNFRMALCYGNGTVIEGAEILNRGTAYHVIQVSNTPMYMIISTSSIDSYRIIFETPQEYYDAIPVSKIGL